MLTQREYLVKKVTSAQVLIIDEVSMLSAEALDSVELVCRTIRGGQQPFGGLQVVLVGDFFQLPPVDIERGARYAFHSQVFQSARLAYCYLDTQYRYEDSVMHGFMTQIRTGLVDELMVTKLLETKKNTFMTGPEPVVIFTHNKDVDTTNIKQLSALSGSVEVFQMLKRGQKNAQEKLVQGCLSPEVLELKVGAKVMFTKNNFEQGYVNGSLGEVVDFDNKFGLPVVLTVGGKEVLVEQAEWSIEDDSGKPVATIKQLPLRLAWAITVHKSQGMSIDRAEVDLGRSFVYGQGYVALSRVRSLEGLRLKALNEQALLIDPRVVEFDKRFRAMSEATAGRLGLISKSDIKNRWVDFIFRAGGVYKSINSTSFKKSSTLEKPVDTYSKTAELVANVKNLEELAKKRNLKADTIVRHLEVLVRRGDLDTKEIAHLAPSKKALEKLEKVVSSSGEKKLKDLKNQLPPSWSFLEIRLGLVMLGN